MREMHFNTFGLKSRKVELTFIESKMEDDLSCF